MARLKGQTSPASRPSGRSASRLIGREYVCKGCDARPNAAAISHGRVKKARRQRELSDRYQAAYTLRFHRLAATLLDDLAAAHDQILVGQLGGEVVELLDQ